MTQPPLQERVLAVLREQRTVRAKDLEHWLPGIDRGGLDCAMNALMRANKVSLALGMYELVKPNAVTEAIHRKAVEALVEPKPAAVVTVMACNGGLPLEVLTHLATSVQTALTAPPTAVEETAPSLAPPAPETTAVCIDCGAKPISEFQHSNAGKPYRRCLKCAAYAISLAVIAASRRKREAQVKIDGLDTVPPPQRAAPPTVLSAATPSTELIGLAHKRAWLVQKREQLLRECEALDERIVELDRVTAQVRALLEAA